MINKLAMQLLFGRVLIKSDAKGKDSDDPGAGEDL